MIGQDQRLRGLVEAGIALTSELSLDAVLGKLVELAASLTGARYAALGVVDRGGSGLERFVHTGIPESVAAEIGEPPVGRGVLGVPTREARPVRLRDLTEDPRSVGFPPGHPPMRTFLGVPVVLRGTVYGNLYLTEKDEGEFDQEDEETVRLLAAQAAVAIENARLYESATHWLRQLETINEIGNALSGELELPALLHLIVTRLRELIDARLVFVTLPVPDGLRVDAVADHDAGELLGMVLPPDTKTARVYSRGRTERVDSTIDDPEIDQGILRSFAEVTGLPVPTSGLFVPLLTGGRTVGVITAHDKLGGRPIDSRFTEEDLRLAEIFAERAAVAIDLSQRLQRDVLHRVVAAQELERKRLARELHDETGQTLTSILLGLRAVEAAGSAEERLEALSSLRGMAIATLTDVRRLAVELRPKTLDDFGLVPALRRLAESVGETTGMRVEMESSLDARLSPDIETALYRIVQEALTNVVKHARARQVSVVLLRDAGVVKIVIEDDGRGFSPEEPGRGGLGLIGMRERLALLDGRLTVESAAGTGTTIVAEVPLT